MDYIKKNINLNTNFLHDMRVNFKPSLLTRILLDGTSKENSLPPLDAEHQKVVI